MEKRMFVSRRESSTLHTSIIDVSAKGHASLPSALPSSELLCLNTRLAPKQCLIELWPNHTELVV
jgi:hypothetical protein